MRFGQQFDRLLAAVAALLATGHPALGRFEAALSTAITARVVDHRAIGQGGKGLQPQINARLLPGWRQGLHWHIGTGDADIPAIGFTARW